MKTKFALLMIVFMALSAVFAAADVCDGDLCVIEVEVDGDEVDTGESIVIERGEELDVRVRMESGSERENVQVQVMISGYEHGVIEDSTGTFDMKEDRIYSKKLQLSVPSDLDVGEDGDEGTYKLRIIISDREGDTIVFDFDLEFEAERHLVEIKDVLLDPSGEVASGRGLIAAVRVKNVGQKDENDGVKVSVSIPALGVQASEFIDELDSDESTTSEDLFLRIPKCAEAGTYVVRAEAEFNDGRDSVTKDSSIAVLEDPSCDTVSDNDGGSRMVITVPKSQEVVAGAAGPAYPIMITNAGSESKTVRVTVSGVESWGAASIEGGSVVVVGPKQTETIYLYVSANADTAEGTQIFVVDVASGDESESIALTANIVAGESESPLQDWGRIKKGLEIGLVVLVVLLVILGLIVGFNKLKGNDEEDDISGQTYY